MIKLGIIGYSKLNGHPYSFSGIINGINKSYFKNYANWPFIYDYLLKNKKKLGFKGMRITHVWTQNYILTKNIANSCLIKNPCLSLKEMIQDIDAVIIARDDWKSHLNLAIPFLKKNIPTFVDKPLTLNKKEMNLFKPYLKKGLLMSCSGLRFSPKILNLKKNLKKLGRIKNIEALVVNNFEKYGVHMLDIINELLGVKYHSIYKISPNKQFYKNKTKNNISFILKCLGKVEKTFDINLFGSKKNLKIKIDDNFNAFYNTLRNFEKMIKTKKNPIKFDSTMNIMNTLKAGSEIKKFNKKNKPCLI